jgi:hypothetical protein
MKADMVFTLFMALPLLIREDLLASSLKSVDNSTHSRCTS